MRRTRSSRRGLGVWLVGVLSAGWALMGGGTGAADPAVDAAAVAKDREAVRGNWRIISLHVGGQKAADEEARRFSLTNDGNGAWTLLRDGVEFMRGTSTIEPAATPKAIDFTATDASGEEQTYLGIYELGEPIRRICFVRPGQPRPVGFSSTVADGQLLIVYERE